MENQNDTRATKMRHMRPSPLNASHQTGPPRPLAPGSGRQLLVQRACRGSSIRRKKKNESRKELVSRSFAHPFFVEVDACPATALLGYYAFLWSSQGLRKASTTGLAGSQTVLGRRNLPRLSALRSSSQFQCMSPGKEPNRRRHEEGGLHSSVETCRA